MNDDEVTGMIQFSFATSLKPWGGDPTRYWFPATGEIVADLDSPDDSDATEAAGRMELKIIRFSEAYNDHVDLSDVFYEAGLGAVYVAMFNSRGGIKKQLDIDLLPGEVIFINAIQLEAKYRPTPLLLQTVEGMIGALTSMGLIVACRDTLDLGNKEWKQLGFDRVPRTQFIYRDDYGMNPRRKAY